MRSRARIDIQIPRVEIKKRADLKFLIFSKTRCPIAKRLLHLYDIVIIKPDLIIRVRAKIQSFSKKNIKNLFTRERS